MKIDDAKLNELAAKAQAVTHRPADTFGRALLDLEEAYMYAADPETVAALVAEVKRWRAVRAKIGDLDAHQYRETHFVEMRPLFAILDEAAGGA